MPYTNIHIMSFEDAAVYSHLADIPPTIVISVDDRGFPLTPIDIDNPAVLGVLKIYVSDTEDPSSNSAMTPLDAERIVAFVEHFLPARPEVLVHCAGGISRSAGIAAALGRWLNGSDAFVMDSPYRRPNFLCYQRVLDAAGVEYDLEAEKERFEQQHEFARRWDAECQWIGDGCWDEEGAEDFRLSEEELAGMEQAWEGIAERLRQRSHHSPVSSGLSAWML